MHTNQCAEFKCLGKKKPQHYGSCGITGKTRLYQYEISNRKEDNLGCQSFNHFKRLLIKREYIEENNLKL